MGSSNTVSTREAVSPEFVAAFLARADASGTMTFAAFMELALYDVQVGYYRQARKRVGYAPGTDFFTASTSGPIFGELIAAACAQLLAGRDPRAHTFVEIGAEPGQSVLADVAHPFGAVRTLRLGEPLDISGPCVVFSNELFDAQPCRRHVFRAGRWREIGVRLCDGQLEEVELPSDVTLPGQEGYCFDQPLASVALAAVICAQPWTGLFVAIDYGKMAAELEHDTPGGTVRAYYRHTQSNDLLARPGEQDLTCHVCWDGLIAVLRDSGFAAPTLQAQEAFFVHHAGAFIAATAEADAARFSRRKQSLMQLLHPAHLGQKFQVLHAPR